jgi:hypothetical protein
MPTTRLGLQRRTSTGWQLALMAFNWKKNTVSPSAILLKATFEHAVQLEVSLNPLGYFH